MSDEWFDEDEAPPDDGEWLSVQYEPPPDPWWRQRENVFATVAGLVLVRQRPATASGVLFMTLEDETGIANVVVWVREQERFRSAVLESRLLRVRGRVERAEGVVHLLAERLDDLTSLIRRLPTASRDFH